MRRAAAGSEGCVLRGRPATHWTRERAPSDGPEGWDAESSPEVDPSGPDPAWGKKLE